MQIATHPYNNSLVVLIHGIMSNRYLAWEGALDMIQSIHSEGSASLRSYDYYAFGYESGYVVQPPIDRGFDALRSLISQPRYDTVVLIGHSQGGVFAKLFVLHELSASRGRDLKVDIVITLDSPHRGPQPWIYPAVVLGGIWKHIFLLNRFPLFRQAADLGFRSRFLNQLRTEWNDKWIAGDPCPPQPKRRHIRTYTVSGTRLPFPPVKLVVSERSARGFKIDQPLSTPPAQRVAWGLGHGIAAMRAYRHQIEQILSDHDSEGIGNIVGQAAGAPAADLKAALLDHYGPADLPCEIECWRRRFVEAFPLRPLRKLPFGKALEKFVKLRLTNP